MPIKSVLLPDHVQVNKYQLLVAGLPPLLFTMVSSIEEELDTVELPDRTTASGGRSKPVEFEVTQPMHHTLERLAMEAWYTGETTDPVLPSYKKVGTLLSFSQSNLIQVSYMLIGLYPFKRTLPDFELENDGEMATIVWGMKADEVTLLS